MSIEELTMENEALHAHIEHLADQIKGMQSEFDRHLSNQTQSTMAMIQQRDSAYARLQIAHEGLIEAFRLSTPECPAGPYLFDKLVELEK